MSREMARSIQMLLLLPLIGVLLVTLVLLYKPSTISRLL